MQAPPEKHAFVAALNPPGSKLNDALLVIDVDPDSRTYGQRVGEVKMPEFGDELHHFGWKTPTTKSGDNFRIVCLSLRMTQTTLEFSHLKLYRKK